MATPTFISILSCILDGVVSNWRLGVSQVGSSALLEADTYRPSTSFGCYRISCGESDEACSVPCAVILLTPTHVSGRVAPSVRNCTGCRTCIFRCFSKFRIPTDWEDIRKHPHAVCEYDASAVVLGNGQAPFLEVESRSKGGDRRSAGLKQLNPESAPEIKVTEGKGIWKGRH